MRNSISIAFHLALLWCTVHRAFGADDPATADRELDATRLRQFQVDGESLSRSERRDRFEHEGEIEAVGSLIGIEDRVYFKTSDQSFIPSKKRFPYAQLYFEIYVSEKYSHRSLIDQSILGSSGQVVYTDAIRVRGNWAYDFPIHHLVLTWVDATEKVPKKETKRSQR
jgi:hypothetical protein